MPLPGDIELIHCGLVMPHIIMFIIDIANVVLANG